MPREVVNKITVIPYNITQPFPLVNGLSGAHQDEEGNKAVVIRWDRLSHRRIPEKWLAGQSSIEKGWLCPEVLTLLGTLRGGGTSQWTSC